MKRLLKLLLHGLILIVMSILLPGCPRKFNYSVVGDNKIVTTDSIELSVRNANPDRLPNHKSKLIFFELTGVNQKVKDTIFITSSDWILYSPRDTFYPVSNTESAPFATYKLQDTVTLYPNKRTDFSFLFASKKPYSKKQFRNSVSTDTVSARWNEASRIYLLHGWKFKQFIWDKGR